MSSKMSPMLRTVPKNGQQRSVIARMETAKAREKLDKVVLKFGKQIIEAVDSGEHEKAIELNDEIRNILYMALKIGLIAGYEYLFYRLHITRCALVR